MIVISKDVESRILRLFHVEKWRVGTIASQLDVHHSVVERVLEQDGVPEKQRKQRPSIVDSYLPFIGETLDQFPRLCASRLFQMVKERGYPGGEDHFRAIVATIRPRKPAEAFLRLKALPGEEAQVDWGHFGKVNIGKATRQLMAFVMVLSYSRRIFLRFYLDQRVPSLLRGHQEAFTVFGGCPRRLLYDNPKTIVLERQGDAIRFHPSLLEFAGHYRFEPRPVAIARGNEKGRVERAIRFIRDSFFAARPWSNLEDLNHQADHWCSNTSMDRRWPDDRSITVREAFENEKEHLAVLPNNPFPVEERVAVVVRKTPYVRFDKNDYSVPHTLVRQSLIVLADPDTVRILGNGEEVARHPRSFGKDETIEDPKHIAKLVDHKRRGRERRGMDRLNHAAPNSTLFLVLVGQRGGNLGSVTANLLRYVREFGGEAVDRALVTAIKQQTPHLNSVRYLLESERQQSGRPPKIPIELPDDPRIRDLTVRSHSLKTYDFKQENINDKNDHDETNDDD